MKTEDLDKIKMVANVDYTTRLRIKDINFADKKPKKQSIEAFKAPEFKTELPFLLS